MNIYICIFTYTYMHIYVPDNIVIYIFLYSKYMCTLIPIILTLCIPVYIKNIRPKINNKM